jgi:hypothetical protein
MPKNDSEGKRSDIQPLLPSINYARFLCDRCPFDTVHGALRKMDQGGPKTEVVELFPPAVLPDSNTGVHHEPSNRGASDSESVD